jgi:hypothetical protein
MIDKITTLSGEKTIQMAIKKPTATHRILRGYYENDRSLRSYLSLISVICNSIPDVASTSVMSKWKCYCEDVNKSVMDLSENNVVSDKLREKWIEYGELKKVSDDLHSKLRERKGSMNEWQALVLISFYAYLPPKRADLGMVKIARCKTPGACTRMVERCNDGNFCIVGDTGILVLNEYKTYETYGKFVEELPSALLEIVKDSLSAQPRDYLLCGLNNRPLSVQSLSNRVGQVMQKYVGVKLSINDLRHIYITQHVHLDTMTIAERKAIAKSMMHSASMALTYVRVL